jgi:cell division protein ZapE
MVAAGDVRDDPEQHAVVARLDRLAAALANDVPRRRLPFSRRRRRAPSKGVYVHGHVGAGKTMLMDVFFALAPVETRRRVHFNEFMGEVQDRLHAARAQSGDDPVGAVAAAISGETRLLCLDEVAVTDIADAMILSRLFQALFADGLVLVATSNSAPEDLYRNGLNRALFLPFIDLLRRHCDIVALGGETDYRLAKLAGTPVYLTPADATARTALDRIWRSLTGTDGGAPAALRTRGREIRVPEASDGVARFGFDDLCRAPLAAHDDVQIARAYHTVLVDGIPVIAAGERDVARRLILFIDTLYDHRVNLIASAAAEPGGLYPDGAGELAFAFRRTVSRLMEMRSEGYLSAAHGLIGGADA